MFEYEVIIIENLSSIAQKQKFNELGKRDYKFICATDKYAYFVRTISDFKIDMNALENMVYGEYEKEF